MFLAALLSVAATIASADDAPPTQVISAEAYADMQARGEAERLEQLEAARGPKAVTTSQRKAQAARMAPIEALKGKVIPRLEWKVGSAGRIWMVDIDGMAAGDGLMRVAQVAGPDAVLLRYGTDIDGSARLAWVDGIDASGAADGGYLTLPQVFEVIGTKTYPTAIGGQATVLHARPVRLPDAAP
ncbi:MAG TPA: hypothetical protein VD838_08175 [Anaeromyxobacteraceae bacterium]|nr:hypothetical protein [Anaeromyxobacteraceae bacterium]